MHQHILPLLIAVLVLAVSSTALAQTPANSTVPNSAEKQNNAKTAKDESQKSADATASDLKADSIEALEQKLQKLLTGARLTGQFTMDGKPLTDLQDETYEIRKAHKLKPNGDTWAIHSRIKYGEHDLVLPVPLQVKWAGTTPVLTLDNMTLPGLGTFSARVVLHGNRYAGTWQHDSVGGHLFGAILPAAEAETNDQTESEQAIKATEPPSDPQADKQPN